MESLIQRPVSDAAVVAHTTPIIRPGVGKAGKRTGEGSNRPNNKCTHGPTEEDQAHEPEDKPSKRARYTTEWVSEGNFYLQCGDKRFGCDKQTMCEASTKIRDILAAGDYAATDGTDIRIEKECPVITLPDDIPQALIHSALQYLQHGTPLTMTDFDTDGRFEISARMKRAMMSCLDGGRARAAWGLCKVAVYLESSSLLEHAATCYRDARTSWFDLDVLMQRVRNDEDLDVLAAKTTCTMLDVRLMDMEMEALLERFRESGGSSLVLDSFELPELKWDTPEGRHEWRMNHC